MDDVTYTPAAASDLDGTLAVVSGAAGADSVQTVGYIGTQRYVRVAMTTSDATDGAFSSANVIAGHPHNAPTQ
jgi:hypothetical protein